MLTFLKRLAKHDFILKKVTRIKKQDIKDYSKSIIKKDWTLINNGFKYAISKELIEKNPLDSIEIQKPKSKKSTKKIRALTLEEQQRFIDSIKNLKK